MEKEDFLLNKTQAELLEIIKQQREIISNQSKLIAQLQIQLKVLLEQIALMRHEKFCSSSEKFTDESSEEEDPAPDDTESPDNEPETDEEDESVSVEAYIRRKPGRKALPTDLPRVEKIYDLEDSEKICACGGTLHCIGDIRSEQLEIIPSVMYILVHVRKKYACGTCEIGVKKALLPPQPIPKSIASPGLLAYILVSKFEDHLPLYRLEKILSRMGVNIPRATLSSWVIRCAEILKPLMDLALEKINQYDVAFADETTIQVLKEPDKTAQQQSYMWMFAGGSPEESSVVYHYADSREHTVPLEMLKDFKGYLHCDGYGGYDCVANKKNIILVGCWYHARRKFISAEKVSKKPGIARFIIKKLAELSKIEKLQGKLSVQAMYDLRQEKALPVLSEIKIWLETNQPKVLPGSLLGKAISYTLNQWPKLINYRKR